jgi:hypothetical protein
MKLPALKEIIEERKNQAVETLSARFAENRLPLEEYERLVEYIHKIESERELAVVEKIVAEYGTEYGGGPAGTAAFSGGEFDDEDGGEYPPGLPFSKSNLTVLSSRGFAGPLRAGAQFVSILGSEHIKIRREDLRRRRTVLQVVSILGDSLIQVEPGIRVINTAIPVLGACWTDSKIGKAADRDGPELLISGAALLGNITVRLLKD